MMRILPLAALAAAAALLLGSCYVTLQGSRYLALLAGARKADRALADPATPEPARALLGRAGAIRSFAVAELGLRDTGSFRSLVELDRDNLAWVVQACAELSFDRYLWAYPLVGRLPYRGYFDPDEADREAARLRRQGYDVLVRPVDAFSTLGFLPDPLWSFMASYGDAELAETIIHEMVHATAFRKGAEAWNEELATFAGREGALAWLRARGAAGAAEIESATAARRDAEAFAAWLAGTARELEALYATELPADGKRAGKTAIIAARARLWREEGSRDFLDQRWREWPMDRLDNAWLDLYRLYEGGTGLHRDWFERVSGGDFRAYMADMASLAAGRGDPGEAMRVRLGR